MHLRHIGFHMSPCLLMLTGILVLLISCSSPETKQDLVSERKNAQATFELGKKFYDENHYRKALEQFEQALAIARQHGLTDIVANCYERMGSIHMATDDPGLAFKLDTEALLLYEKGKDSMGIAKIYNVMGIYLLEGGKYDSAEQFFRKAIEINTRMNNRQYLVENRANLSYLYESKGEYDKAETGYNMLVKELQEVKDSTALHVIFYNLASLYQRKNRDDTAMVFLDRAISIAEPRGDTALLSTLYGNKGELYLKMQRFREAKACLEKSIRFARAIDDVETEATAMGFMIRVDSALGDYRTAYQNSRRIFVLKDSIAARYSRNNVNSIRIHYENEKRKDVIEMQHHELESARKEKHLYIGLLTIGLFTGILAIVFFIRELKSQARKRRLTEKELVIKELKMTEVVQKQEIDRLRLEKTEAELRSKEREMLVVAMGIEQKNELLSDIAKKIGESLKVRPETDHLAIVNEVINSIKMQMNTSGEAELFKQQFTQVHEHFHENLKKAHPDLTRSEIKFCAYLRLNLSGNQIAHSLNVTQEAIRKSRYRIRKKMQLSPEESLENYISKF